ncbi:diguanylate cyclase domain-containing protein [Halomonas sp. HNIBRBA4712]|uniref:diguanylate cyclase domain-containing protein n=1 Tax=Halomonas sp. HNIBRBA4712 TaxID=3373087 RepID=UPI0037456067
MLWKLKPASIVSIPSEQTPLLNDLQAAKIALLYEKLWQPVLSSLIVAGFIAMIVWPAESATVILCWLSSLCAVTLFRLVLARRYQRAASSAQQNKWLYLFSAGTLVSAALWGAAGIAFFDPGNPMQTAAVAIVIAGVAAGGTTTLSSVRWVGGGYSSLILLPQAAVYLLHGSLLTTQVGAVIALFWLLLLATCARFNQIIHDNFALKISIEARKAELVEAENRYRSIYEHSSLGVLHFDRFGTITECNDQMLAILGGEREGFIGYRMLERTADPEVAQAVRDALKKGSGYFEGTFHLPGVEQGTPLRAIFNGVNSSNLERLGGIAIVEDFTERTRNEAIIYRQAYYDSLTDLPNRRLFIERLMGLCDAEGSSERTGVVIFLDLDRFKLINDTFGHAAGDDLLIQIARRMEEHLENDDMAARLSGDEFVMLKLIERPFNEATEEDARRAMGALQDTLSGEYHLETQQVEVTPSMGYTCFNAAECDHTEILKQADVAMYQAKSEGRGRLRRYRPHMRQVFQQASGRATSLIAR